MKTGFTRETISPAVARRIIFLAVFWPAFRGLVTLYAIFKHVSTFTLWNLLDVAIMGAVSAGIFLRFSYAAWVGLIYWGLDTALKMSSVPEFNLWRRLTEPVMYAMAIVMIGLYPRQRIGAPSTSDRANAEPPPPQGPGHEAV